MSKPAQFRGDLSETPLPELLFSIERFRVPGFFEVSWQGTSKRVYLRDGYVIHASSTDRADSLGVYLQRHGRITAEEFERTNQRRKASHERFGVLLVESGIMSPAEVYEAVRKHIEQIIWGLFYWKQGLVTFTVGGFKEEDSIQIQLPLRQVILEGIRQAPEAKALVARLGARDEVFEPCYRGEDLIEIGIDTEELKLLKMVDGSQSLYDLCSKGPKTPAENAKLLYAFQTLQLVRRPRAPRDGTGPVRIQLRTTGDGFSG